MCYIFYRYGRKRVCLFIGPLCLLSWAIIIFTRSIEALYVARYLQGLATSTAFSVVPIYTAEIVDPSMRGALSGFVLIAYFIGCIYSFCLGPYLSYNIYTIASVIPPLIYTIGFIFFPESPYWLIKRGRIEEAKKNLSWFRAKTDLNKEFNSIQRAVEEEINNTTKNPLKTLFCNKYERKSFIMVQIISIAKFLTGVTTITNFSTETFSKTVNFISPNVMSILLVIISLLFAGVSAGLSDRVGRKSLLLVSCLGCFIFHFISGLYYFLVEKTDVNTSPYLWMMYTGIIGYSFFSGIGISPLHNTIKAELFGAHTREIAIGITESIAAVLSFVAICMFGIINARFGVFLNFWLYSVVALSSGIIILVFMFETSGKPIGRMETSDVKTKCSS